MNVEIFNKGKKLDFVKMIDYSEGGVIRKQVLKTETGSLTLLSFDQGQGLSKHVNPLEVIVQIIDGKAEITIESAVLELNVGESVIIPPNVPHVLHATEKFKMLLTTLKP